MRSFSGTATDRKWNTWRWSIRYGGDQPPAQGLDPSGGSGGSGVPVGHPPALGPPYQNPSGGQGEPPRGTAVPVSNLPPAPNQGPYEGQGQGEGPYEGQGQGGAFPTGGDQPSLGNDGQGAPGGAQSQIPIPPAGELGVEASIPTSSPTPAQGGVGQGNNQPPTSTSTVFITVNPSTQSNAPGNMPGYFGPYGMPPFQIFPSGFPMPALSSAQQAGSEGGGADGEGATAFSFTTSVTIAPGAEPTGFTIGGAGNR